MMVTPHHPRRHKEDPTIEVTVRFERVRQSRTHSFYRCTWVECEDPLDGYRHFSIEVLIPVKRDVDPKPVFKRLSGLLVGKIEVPDV